MVTSHHRAGTQRKDCHWVPRHSHCAKKCCMNYCPTPATTTLMKNNVKEEKLVLVHGFRKFQSITVRKAWRSISVTKAIHTTVQSGWVNLWRNQDMYNVQKPPLVTLIPPARSYLQMTSQASKIALWGGWIALEAGVWKTFQGSNHLKNKSFSKKSPPSLKCKFIILKTPFAFKEYYTL